MGLVPGQLGGGAMGSGTHHGGAVDSWRRALQSPALEAEIQVDHYWRKVINDEWSLNSSSAGENEMKSKKTIKRGVVVAAAAGVFAGAAIFVTMISGCSVGRGIIIGFISAALVIAVYSVIAVCRSDKPCESGRENKA